MKKKKKNNKTIYYNNDQKISIFDVIENKKYRIEKILKDDKRSFVSIIDINGSKYVYKVPREKNRRKWQRFLSIFRGSQSKREFFNIEKIQKLGFKCAEPILAVETSKGPFIVDSYFIYSFITGHQALAKDAPDVAMVLQKIHELGYLHGDSQLENFIIENNTVFLIDTSFIKNKYGKFGEAYEFIYLEESCHDGTILYDRNSIFYKGALLLKKYFMALTKIKEFFRGKRS